MKSQNLPEFWARYWRLPNDVRAQARRAYRQFCDNPDHSSLNFKKLRLPGSYWSVRFGDGYRAVCRREGDTVIWFWIGTHQAFDKFI